MRNFQHVSKDESQSQISKNVEEPKKTSANFQDNLYSQLQSDFLTSNQNGMVAMQKAYGNRFIQRMFSDSQISDEEPSWNYQTVDDFHQHMPEDSDERLAQRIEKAIGSGNQLESDVLGDLENGLGVNLTHLRIHQDAEADSLAHSFNAAAFTTGSDIFFRHGTFNPRTENGFRLLAHETTHVVQQRNSSLNVSENNGPLTVSDPSDQFEQEADAAAEKIVAGQAANVLAREMPSVARSDDDDSIWGSVWNGITNNALSGGLGILEEAGRGAKLGTGLSRTGGAAGMAGNVLAPLGLASSAMSIYDTVTSPGTFGLNDLSDTIANTAGGVSSAIGTVGSAGALASYLGGSSILTGTATGGALSAGGGALTGAASAAWPVAAVAGSAAGGYAVGRGADELFGGLMNYTGASAMIDEARGVSRPEGQSGDYSLSGIGGDLTYAADSAVTGGLRSLGVFDEDEPAYTQTLGWQLAEALPSWLQ